MATLWPWGNVPRPRSLAPQQRARGPMTHPHEVAVYGVDEAAVIRVTEQTPMCRRPWRRRIWVLVTLWGALLLPWRAACGADSPPAFDFGAVAPWDDGGATAGEYDAIVAADDQPSLALLPPTISVAREMLAPAGRRFYLTSIVGGSFLVVSPNNTPASCLTGGGAAGLAFERSNGRIRLETEGRYRGLIEQTYLGFNENFSPRDPNPVGIVQAKNLGGWSVLANVWRDFRLNDRFDVYGGGGIGATGFETSFQQIDVTRPEPATRRNETGYAWQIGVGGIWNVSERVAVDASYRLFGTGWTITREGLAAGFPRNEILISLRVYEPFRGLMR
jgi:opacity protein-like surface antigen